MAKGNALGIVIRLKINPQSARKFLLIKIHRQRLFLKRKYIYKLMVDGYERYTIAVRQAYHDIVSSSEEISEKFIRELHGVANHVKTTPNSLGRIDKHKINLVQRQLHPSMIGLVDLLQSSKDVGQSGMISPWADTAMLFEADVNKYPNVKFELFDFICREFPNPALTFDCDNIVDYNRMLDKLVAAAYINFEYKIPEKGTVDS
jgi:hypothetical protein